MSTYQLIHGDCIDILPTLEADSVDIVITDPPYNVGFNYEGYDDMNRSYNNWCKSWLSECLRVSPCVVLTSGMKNISLFASFSPTWVMSWHKPNQCSPSALGGFNAWEPIFVYGKSKKRIGHDAFSMSIRTNQHDVDNHPCPKDLRAWSYIVGLFTDIGYTVLDPFMGSGTTGVASMKSNVDFIGIEVNAGYFEIAQQRISNANGDYVTTKKEKRNGQMAIWDALNL